MRGHMRGISLRDRLLLQALVDDDGCWLWTGALLRNGYARLRTEMADGGKSRLAHRASYEEFVGPIPEGLTIDHLCRVRHCVNPAHLEAVTHRENIMRGETRAAENAAKTVCIHGHEFTFANTYVSPDGKRACRTCQRDRRARYLRKRAAA